MRVLQNLRFLATLLALFIVGCGSAPITIQKDLGQMPAIENGVEGAAERRAMLELLNQAKQDQNASVLVIEYQGVWPSGSILPVTLTYNRQEHTLQRQSEKGRGLVYSGVTDDVISATVREAELAEDVEKHGATRVPNPLENKS